MKPLFCLVFLILFSCTDSNQVKDIELLIYFDDPKDFQVYSTINTTGLAQTLYKSEKSKSIDNCQSQIRKTLMDSIMRTCENKNEADFVFKASKYTWYCGNWHSVRITYENGKNIVFRYPYANSENKQFLPFQALSEQIQKDTLSANRSKIGQLSNIHTKQEKFSAITFEKDSLAFVESLKKEKQVK
ncbi:hypothetical protein [Flavobacterium pedocola]